MIYLLVSETWCFFLIIRHLYSLVQVGTGKALGGSWDVIMFIYMMLFYPKFVVVTVGNHRIQEAESG